ncbi:MAG TPA: uracil-DNA glycosylase family protein [Azospirillaceae bacterium]|nr:uracil-DNA glycosylase family protein [Azospirillaceae bacterium]
MSRAALLADLAARARACRLCEAHLPLGPRPTFRVSAAARLLIVGQAPGTKVHETGIPWNDASGDRLRQWLDLDRAAFYDESRVAILPSGFCYPGVDKNGGDKPPRPECAPTWHPLFRELLPQVELTLLVGSYAQAYYLGRRRKPTVTATVTAWREYLPAFLPTPHPSWRNTAWLRKHPWFEDDLLPVLRERVRELLDGP